MFVNNPVSADLKSSHIEREVISAERKGYWNEWKLNFSQHNDTFNYPGHAALRSEFAELQLQLQKSVRSLEAHHDWRFLGAF